jgi:hypothetical protein
MANAEKKLGNTFCVKARSLTKEKKRVGEEEERWKEKEVENEIKCYVGLSERTGQPV